MSRVSRLFPVLVIATVLSAAGFAGAAEHVDSKSGPIKLAGTGSQPVKITLGEKVKLSPEFKVINVGNSSAVNVRGDIQNSTDQKVFYSYHVAFLDKDKNLIACQNFSLWLDPGKKGSAGTFIGLSPAQTEKIAFYSAVLYEGEKGIGTK